MSEKKIAEKNFKKKKHTYKFARLLCYHSAALLQIHVYIIAYMYIIHMHIYIYIRSAALLQIRSMIVLLAQ